MPTNLRWALTLCSALAMPAGAAPGPRALPLTAAAIPAGWELAGEPLSFGPENLYEHIDGAAPGYLRYDFRELLVQPVREAADPRIEILVEVYRFGNHLDAFGIYSNERGPGLEFVDLGAQGYFAGPAARFYKGLFYVKLNPNTSGEAVGQAVRQIAAALSRDLPGESRAPAILAALPRQGLTPGSERYEGSDLLAHGFLGAGFTADYDLGGGKSTKLFFAIKPTAAEARTAYWALLDFLRGRGEVGDRFSLPRGSGRNVRHPYYGPSIVAQSGTIVCGALQVPDQAAGRRLIDDLLARLPAFVGRPR